jgi:anti-sigma factor RsiW
MLSLTANCRRSERGGRGGVGARPRARGSGSRFSYRQAGSHRGLRSVNECTDSALMAAAQTEPSKPSTRRRYLSLVVVGAAALAACLVLTLASRAPRDPAIEQALVARENARTPSRELDGRDLANVAAVDQAMSAMLGNPVRAPDLERAGFKLVSAEIYGDMRSDAVQLRYEDSGRRLLTVFLRPPAGPDAFEVTQRGSVRICVWQNADVTAVMTGEMSTPELLRLASLTYSSLGL